MSFFNLEYSFDRAIRRTCLSDRQVALHDERFSALYKGAIQRIALQGSDSANLPIRQASRQVFVIGEG